MDPHDLGRLGEDAACELLEQLGYRILERNASLGGVEVDVVAIDERETRPTVVFCEVKTRSRIDMGLPSEAVREAQQRRLRRGAGAWLARHGRRGHPQCRFDIVEILVRDGEIAGRVISDAF